MGMNTANVDRTYILYLLKNDNITAVMREAKINSIFNSEILVMDKWVSKFYDELRPKERKIRKNLYEKYRFDSGASFINDKDFEDIKSLSEALISLVGPCPQWLDIVFIAKKLDLHFEDEEIGRFELLRKKCIDAIVEHFDK